MAFPTLTSITVSIIIFLVGGPLVYLLSKALKLSPKSITISYPRREAIPVFLVIIATFVITSALNVFVNTIVKPTFQLDKRPQFTFDYSDVLVVAFSYFIVFLPLITAMKINKQNRASIGINKEHGQRMFALGLVLSLIYIMVEGFFAPSLGGGFIGFSSSLVYGLVCYAIVGFSEEIMWRGYVQTRLIAYSSTAKGLITTALLFSLAHFPTRYYLLSGVVLEAFVSSLLLLPISLLFGYIMLKSQNILPSSILHLLANWSNILWQIPAP